MPFDIKLSVPRPTAETTVSEPEEYAGLVRRMLELLDKISWTVPNYFRDLSYNLYRLKEDDTSYCQTVFRAAYRPLHLDREKPDLKALTFFLVSNADYQPTQDGPTTVLMVQLEGWLLAFDIQSGMRVHVGSGSDGHDLSPEVAVDVVLLAFELQQLLREHELQGW